MIANSLVVADTTHPFYHSLCSHYDVRGIEEAMASYETYDYVFDLSSLRTQKKYFFLKELARTTKAQVISDLTMCWGEWIYHNCSFVVGGLSTHFYSPTDSLEFSLKDSKDQKTNDLINQFYQSIGKKGVLHTDHQLSFHYPRTIAMIINEAYFALEEKLATANDIDLAMKNGVNYPLGPIEWGKKIGLANVIELLRELREVTGEDRYKISHQLKLEAIKL